MNILVTGGAGFIGSHFVRLMLEKEEVTSVINLDKLTYAGNLETIADIMKHPKHTFVKGDIADRDLVRDLFSKDVNVVVNFAAETHVDRSIMDARDFIRTDMEGVFVLLEASRDYNIDRFIQVSTDEVYGSIAEGFADENYPLMPANPYSASKAGGDRLAYSFFNTYKVPVIITRTCNNYGPHQYPEKLIPLFITNAMTNQNLPLYGDGLFRRDWIHAIDHCLGIWFLIQHGELGEVYNISASYEATNIEITQRILKYLGKDEDLIKYVKDRPGHDRRYAINCDKILKLGWKPAISFEKGIDETIQWYMDNEKWWGPLKSGEFQNYYKNQYKDRKG